MRPSQTKIERRDTNGISEAETDNDKKLMIRADLGMIVGSAVAGLGILILLSFWLAVGRIPFIVGAAVPLFTLIAIIYQAVVYRRQLRAMVDGLERTDRVINNMQGQLKISESQSRSLANQIEISREQKEVMAGQLQAMTDQLKVMEDSLKATRESVNVAWDALKTERRAYVGIDRMNIDLVKKKRLWIHLKNSGKTPASDVKAKIQVTTSTPSNWHETRPQNVRLFGLGEEEYSFNLTTIHPDSIAVQIGFPLGRHFSDEELALVVQKDSRLTVNLTLDYYDGFDKEFAYFVITYRGKDTHGYDTWGIFPTETEKEYDQTNPERPELKIL